MSRENFDIPEVFRKAMEEAGWAKDNGGGDDQGGNGDDRPPVPGGNGRSLRPNRTVIILGLLFLLLLSFNWIVTTYTEWLWFGELGYNTVWLKRWGVQVLSFVIGFVIAAIILLANWHGARRRAGRSTPPFYPQFLQLPGIGWIINGVGLFFAFIFASAAGGQWETFLRFIYRVPFGVDDPIFGQDVSFYLFELPVYDFLQGWFISILLITLLGTFAIYAINYLPAIQRGQWQPQKSPGLLRHIALAGALFLGLWALGYGLDIFGLNYSGRGVVFGASYTDMNATLYALWAQMIFLGLTALTVAYNAIRFDLRPVLVAGGLWIASAFLLGGVYPSLLQRYSVEPNEIERERPYIAYNIESTRRAFGLDKIQTRDFTIGDDLQQIDLTAHETVLQNVRLWDYRPLRDTYTQLQALRTYYQFHDVDIDRYTIDGRPRQVMLAARELDKSQLPAPSWVNRNLEFTHGYGLVMNPVNEITPEGQPEFFIKDLPPQASVPIPLERPEIYYGETTTDAVFVSSGREEFDYPSGDLNIYSTYQGTGGVLLDNILNRVAFALRLGDINVLLSDDINEGTRVQFHRQIAERVNQITPFLWQDADPYLVVWNGRLVWMIDTYTVSNRYPYSTPISVRNRTVNYMRNTVKVVIDAYNGDVTYYIADPDDPIIRTYDKAFPGLFRPLSEMPETLQAHLRYPEGLFNVQMQQYLTYHMTDERVFYNKEDLWEIPLEFFDETQQPMEPYYVTLPLPGENESEFLLIQPFTPSEKPNMVAWVAARSDQPHYGELFAYQLSKQELVFGPSQVEGRINQETTISEQFSLWDQRGSRVIRGNLIVIPLENNFLYVEPVYLRSETNALPELKRVIVASRNRIAMAVTLEGALAALLQAPELAGGDAALEEAIVAEVSEPAEGEEETTEETAVEPEATPLPEAPADADVEALVASANDHFEAAQEAQRNGDWATYGTELEALQQDLSRLMELTGTTP